MPWKVQDMHNDRACHIVRLITTTYFRTRIAPRIELCMQHACGSLPYKDGLCCAEHIPL